MKYNLLFLIILFSCKKEQEKIVSNILVNYVSTAEEYGQLCKPPFYINKKIIKNQDFTIQIYEDKVHFKRIDTLKICNNGVIFFNNIQVEKIDTKNIIVKNIVMTIQKIYIPHVAEIGVDDFSGKIIYLTNDGIIARYSIISNYIFLYQTNIYSELHDKILHQNFTLKETTRSYKVYRDYLMINVSPMIKKCSKTLTVR